MSTPRHIHSAAMTPRSQSRRLRSDRGAVLPMVLIFVVLAATVVLPLLSYAVTVMRSGQVQSDKAEAVEAARGGTWVALSNQDDLYDLCPHDETYPSEPLTSSIDDVTTECTTLRVETLRPEDKVPYHVATVRADAVVPPQIATPETYVNPNTTAAFDTWLTNPDWEATPNENTVWMPSLPVRATSSSGTRDTPMLPNAWDPLYSSCRVFFPGTFNTPIVLNGPTYFTSGVYYFTEAITITRGADVVVGSGSAGGCTTDFEAIAGVDDPPDPLNMSGIGGTWVLGGDARIDIDDATGSGDIRFVINRRYVAENETSVQASRDVSIVTVNGAHEPYLGSETNGDNFIVPGQIAVPASRVGTDGDPIAALEGYEPSTVSYRPGLPGAPQIVDVGFLQDDAIAYDDSPDGRLTVSWTAPADGGSPIIDYIVTDTEHGGSCSPPAPIPPSYELQTSCTITDHVGSYFGGPFSRIEVVAVNANGTSDPSVAWVGDAYNRVDLFGDLGSQVPEVEAPDSPLNVAVTDVFSDGLRVNWDEPTDDGGSPIARYRVEVIDTVTSTTATCDASWDQRSCVVPITFAPATPIDINVVALHVEGSPEVERASTPTFLSTTLTPGATPAPPPNPPPASLFDPAPVIDLTTNADTPTEIVIEGYVSVPQGKVNIGAVFPAQSTVQLTGGVLAADIEIDRGGSAPGNLEVFLDNPEAQKQIRLESSYGGSVKVTSEAIVQINKSGSIGINSWIVQ